MSGHTGFFLPPPYEGDRVQRFSGPSGTNGWLTWSKPAGAQMISIIMAGGGGGGGNGHSAAAAAARGGGGGGGSAALSRIAVPAWMLPDDLYIQVGSGGAANGAGTASFVSVIPSTAASNVLITANGGGAGGNGTGAAAGAAGAAGSAATSANAILSAWGISVPFIAGQAGTIGGVQTGATPAALTPYSVSFLSGGSGGAGVTATDFAGAAISAVAPWPLIPGGVAGGGVGSPGRVLWSPTLFTGGTGGGSSNAGPGGAGGDGGPGCGGGGGGGGTTGGGGGRGGNGFVWIIAS